MHGDPVQPSCETAALLEACQGPPSGNEAFLSTILGRFPLAREPQAQAVDPRRELPIQVFEGGEVAVGRGCYEFGRLGGGIHGSRSLRHLNRPYSVAQLLYHLSD
jgi:hypothetical protein